jgi:hypothetical protein
VSGPCTATCAMTSREPDMLADMAKTAIVQARVDVDVRHELERIAADRYITLSALVADILADYVESMRH